MAPRARPVPPFQQAILALPRPLLLAFDVDGTLAPIVSVPGRARVPAKVVRCLAALSGAPGVRLAVITGRDPEALSRMLPLDDLYRGVLHGKQVARPRRPVAPLRLSAAQRQALRAFEHFAQEHLAGPGVWLEPKPGALGVHVRRLEARDPAAAKTLLLAAIREARRLGLKAHKGRAIVEVEAHSGDKGEALLRIHRLCRAKSVVFLGDDLTDVPALRYASQHGVGLFVRSPERSRKPLGVTGALADIRQAHALVAGLTRALA